MRNCAVWEGFDEASIEVEGVSLFTRWKGNGPPVVLLHGFPQTHLMWRDVAPLLADDFTVFCVDLRGYGQSSCPASETDHASYSKRVMGRDLIRLMKHFGRSKFMIAGHDRGGRVAYRTALDNPDAVMALAVLDIVPTAAAWDRADARLALGFWPWSLLAQPAPLPERLIAAAPDAVIDNALGGWGSSSAAFPAPVRQAYIDALKDPAHIHAICEEYRAAAGIEREHDARDLAAGHVIGCKVLALWSGKGALAEWYDADGGPLEIWRDWATDIRGGPVEGGHFFPEEHPVETAAALRDFFLE